MAVASASATTPAAQATTPAVDLRGGVVDPLDHRHRGAATVLIFVDAECPVSNRAAPEIQRLVDEFTPRGVRLWLVYPNDTAQSIRRHLTDFRLTASPLSDLGRDLVRRTGVTVTPEAAVFDAEGQLRYRGRLDDRQLDLVHARPQARRRDLREAIAALLEGGIFESRTLPAVGCYIPPVP